MFISKLRYAVVSFPNFTPKFQHSNPNFIARRLHSRSHDEEDEDSLVSSFNRLLHQNPTPSIIQFSKILGSLVKANHYSTAASLHRQMVLKGFASDLVALTILINCFSQLGLNSLSFSVFANILKMGYHPNAITFTTIIKGLCRCRKIIVDTITYNSLIDGLCKSGRISYALQLVDEMYDRSQPPDIITYNSILDALCKNNHIDKAIALLTKIKEKGIQLDMFTYTILIDGLCQSGRLKDARMVFEDLLVKGYNLNVYIYTVMIKGFCNHDLFDEALAMLSKMKDSGCIPDAKTYETIILSLFEKDENDKAEKLLREMIERGLL